MVRVTKTNQGSAKAKRILVETTQIESARPGVTDQVSISLFNNLKDASENYFAIEGVENFCRTCNEGCWNSKEEGCPGALDEDDPDYEEAECWCPCLCDEEARTSLQFTVEQGVEIVKAIREVFEKAEHPQLHLIQEDVQVVLTAGAP